MKILKVENKELCSGLPIKGWDAVKSALQAFYEGRARNSRNGLNHQLKAIGDAHGGMAVAITLYAEAIIGHPNDFVERMTTQAEKSIRERGRWSGSYDYDAMGTPFFKSSVNIDLVDKKNDIYILRISVVRSEGSEEGLAELLGTQCALVRQMIDVVTEPADESHFTFDFDEIYPRLGSLLGLKKNVGKEIVKAMVASDHLGGPISFMLREDDNIRVSLYLGQGVGGRFVRNPKDNRKPKDTWRVDGSVLTGLLDDSLEDHTKKDLPRFVISVEKKPATVWFQYNPVWEPALRQIMTNLASEISKRMTDTK